MLKCIIFMESWIPVSEHWDDKRRATWMTREGATLDDTEEVLG
ncbi:MAG: hypothetical protein ACR5K9_01755 [Wolbachia sp.]